VEIIDQSDLDSKGKLITSKVTVRGRMVSTLFRPLKESYNFIIESDCFKYFDDAYFPKLFEVITQYKNEVRSESRRKAYWRERYAIEKETKKIRKMLYDIGMISKRELNLNMSVPLEEYKNQIAKKYLDILEAAGVNATIHRIEIFQDIMKNKTALEILEMAQQYLNNPVEFIR
jgi:hypothetical protein